MKVTFPGYEPGAVAVHADGIQVGHILAGYHQRWTAYLWAVAGRPGEGFAAVVEGGKLAPLREQVRQRAAREPWWVTATDAAREEVAG